MNEKKSVLPCLNFWPNFECSFSQLEAGFIGKVCFNSHPLFQSDCHYSLFKFFGLKKVLYRSGFDVFERGMKKNTDEQQIDHGLDCLSDLAKGEFRLAEFPDAMGAVISKVLRHFDPNGLSLMTKLMMKPDKHTFALRWIEPHPETLSYDEYVEFEYGNKNLLTNTQKAKIYQLLRKQDEMLPSTHRELLLSRKESLLLMTALYMPYEFLPELGVALGFLFAKRMNVETRAEIIGSQSKIRVLAKSRDLQPLNQKRVQLHEKAIAVATADIAACRDR
jgi:hypothetical protein